jgi:hypothetical protein
VSSSEHLIQTQVALTFQVCPRATTHGEWKPEHKQWQPCFGVTALMKLDTEADIPGVSGQNTKTDSADISILMLYITCKCLDERNIVDRSISGNSTCMTSSLAHITECRIVQISVAACSN